MIGRRCLMQLIAVGTAVSLAVQSCYGVSGFAFRVSGSTRNSQLETRNAVGCFGSQALALPAAAQPGETFQHIVHNAEEHGVLPTGLAGLTIAPALFLTGEERVQILKIDGEAEPNNLASIRSDRLDRLTARANRDRVWLARDGFGNIQGYLWAHEYDHSFIIGDIRATETQDSISVRGKLLDQAILALQALSDCRKIEVLDPLPHDYEEILRRRHFRQDRSRRRTWYFWSPGMKSIRLGVSVRVRGGEQEEWKVVSLVLGQVVQSLCDQIPGLRQKLFIDWQNPDSRQFLPSVRIIFERSKIVLDPTTLGRRWYDLKLSQGSKLFIDPDGAFNPTDKTPNPPAGPAGTQNKPLAITSDMRGGNPSTGSSGETLKKAQDRIPDGSPLAIYDLLVTGGKFNWIKPSQLRLRTRGRAADGHLSLATVMRDLKKLQFLGLVETKGEGDDLRWRRRNLALDGKYESAVRFKLGRLGDRPSAAQIKEAKEKIDSFIADRGMTEIELAQFQKQFLQLGLPQLFDFLGIEQAVKHKSDEIEVLTNNEYQAIALRHRLTLSTPSGEKSRQEILFTKFECRPDSRYPTNEWRLAKRAAAYQLTPPSISIQVGQWTVFCQRLNEGVNLARFPLNNPDVVNRTAEAIGFALGQLHAVGIYHGDLAIRDENDPEKARLRTTEIFIQDRSGKIKASFQDFGLSKDEDNPARFDEEMILVMRGLARFIDERRLGSMSEAVQFAFLKGYEEGFKHKPVGPADKQLGTGRREGGAA